MTDPWTQFYRIKSALHAAGMHDEALALEGVLNAGNTFAHALGLFGHWQPIVRNRDYDNALASLKSGSNNSKSAAHLIHDLHRYERQFDFDRQSGPPADRHAALYTILSGDGGKVLTHGSYRKKFAKL